MHMRARLLVVATLIVTFVVFVCTTGVAQALLVKMSPAKMARVSQRVVVADVWSLKARHIEPADGRNWGTIVTVVRLKVVDRLKGTSPRWITLRIPGGTADGRTRVVEDTPAFYPGERVLLFLDAHGVVGWRQGALEIVDGEVAAWDVSLGAATQRISGQPVRKTLSVAGRGALSPIGAARTVQPRALQTILSDGFESGMGNWTLSGSTTWGQTGNRKQAGSYSAYGTQGAGAAPAAYPAGADSRMTYGPFSLSNATAASLDFDLWKMSADANDKVQVFYSADNSSYAGYSYNNTAGAWSHATQDLSNVPNGSGGYRSLLGQSSVWIMIRFVSDASGQTECGYVDDVVISKTYTGASDPVISGISPGSASAGTGNNVTISGSNFGASQGSGNVTFYYNSTDRITAPIVSWSDAEIVCTVPTGSIKGYSASAGSGPVIVKTNAGPSSPGYTFTVTFSYGGVKWASPAATYRINANCVDTTGETALVDAAWPIWNPPSLWTLDRSGTCTTTSLPATDDGFRDLFWSPSSLGTGVLAVNQYWYLGSTIIDSDIAFNDADFTWGDGTVAGTYDIQTVALHELGHTINLRDLYGPGDTGDVMYGMTASATQKRSLSADDTAGVVWVYGARPAMSGSMKVKSDAVWTNSPAVTLNSSIVNATQMQFQNQGGSWSGWEAYSATRAGWSLTAGDGTKTVNAEFKDAGGNVYSSSDSIGYDGTVPTTSDNGDGLPHVAITLTLTPSDLGSGVAATEYRIDGGGWVSGTSVSLRGAMRHKRGGYRGGSHTIDYRSTDNAGNVESFKSRVVTLS